MRKLLTAVVLCLVLTSLSFAQGVPGQLTNLSVTKGYHVGLFLVFEGSTNGLPYVFDGQGAKTIVWVNGFSTVAEFHGTWKIMIPVASISEPADGNAAIITVKAFQEKTNVEVTKDYNLTDLNRIMKSKINLEWFRRH